MIVSKSDSEYEALVKRMNSNFRESLAEVRSDPKIAEDLSKEMPPELRENILTGEIPAFPVDPSVYYGMDYTPIDCD